MPQPNMKKQYRAELRQTNTKLRAIDRMIDKIHRAQKQRVTAFDRWIARRRLDLRKEYDKTLRAIGRRALPLLRRRSILEGRLS